MLPVELSDTQLVSATIHNVLNGGRMRGVGYTRQIMCLQISFGDLYLSTLVEVTKKIFNHYLPDLKTNKSIALWMRIQDSFAARG